MRKKIKDYIKILKNKYFRFFKQYFKLSSKLKLMQINDALYFGFTSKPMKSN